MREPVIFNQPTIEAQLSHLNARLADAMELLQYAAAGVRQSRAILSGLEAEIEELYLSMTDG